jgi:hypothetical protein
VDPEWIATQKYTKEVVVIFLAQISAFAGVQKKARKKFVVVEFERCIET